MGVSFKIGFNTVSIDFGNYSSIVGVAKSKWRIDKLASVFLKTNGNVVIRPATGADYTFTFDGAGGTLKVDLVEDVVPTSAEHLYFLISDTFN
jgi:predicted Rdx family selenoprotein